MRAHSTIVYLIEFHVFQKTLKDEYSQFAQVSVIQFNVCRIFIYNSIQTSAQ